MENQELEIRRRITDFIGEGINEGEGIAFVNAMYGFYVNHFHKVCVFMELPQNLSDELYNASKEVKEEFLELVEELNPDVYDDLGLRICSECGKFMCEGYYLAGEYACSEECAVKNYMHTSYSHSEDGIVDEETAKKLFQNDLDIDEEQCLGEVYYTEW